MQKLTTTVLIVATEGRKYFFFEKKKQKTFVTCFFFSKKKYFLPSYLVKLAGVFKAFFKNVSSAALSDAWFAAEI